MSRVLTLSEREALEKSTSKYVGDKPLGIVASGEWPESLAGGQFKELNDLYDEFLSRRNAEVQLCFKRLGIYSFGGFGSSADTEGNAATFDDDGGDSTFDSVSKIKADALNQYLMIPINPEEIKVEYQINTTSHQTIFFSELATLSGLKLRRFTINSFLPYRISANRKYGTEPIYRPQDYIKWITDCMDNKVILAFKAFGDLAEPLPYMKCFIESFDTTLRANGEVSYSLSICEYIDYRKNIDTRMFMMEGDTLIVSPKEESRDDGKIGLGDLVYVIDGTIYSDKLKHSSFNVGTITNSFFRCPPSIITSGILTKSGSEEYFKKFQVAGDVGNSVVYNLANAETIEYIAEMIKAKTNVDKTEIWMIVGGDYFSKYRGTTMTDVLTSSVAQIQNFAQSVSPQSMSHTIKIRSMKNNRIGWVDKSQLKRVKL